MRPRLLERLKSGLHRKLTLISAPAGFGKTTLVSEWVGQCQRPAAWLSLDKDDSDLRFFLIYLVSALQAVPVSTTANLLETLQTSPAPPIQSILTALVNAIAAAPDDFILVLDDYHRIEAKPVDQALSFLIENAPPQMHLVITTREDPNLPLGRLRASGQLNEIRAADLRFTHAEAGDFLNQAMGLGLSAEKIAALEARTEGWIVGLQLAALSMRGQTDSGRFVESFTGSHQFVLDYLVEEVLLQQPERIQTFLLSTSILKPLCGPLCDAVLLDPAIPGQATLETIRQANLFLTPLDNERRWYRYHQLFADLLQQRLRQDSTVDAAELHRRASQWYEDNGLEIEAFEHAAAAKDTDRAERLMAGRGIPLQYRGAMTPVLNWLASLPKTLLDDRPSLWMAYALTLTIVGKPAENIEEILQSTESALQNAPADEKTRDLTGHVAAIRAMLAVPRNQVETIITQSRRALDYLAPDNLSVRTTAAWTLGFAYQLQGDRAAAFQAHSEALKISQASGNLMIAIAAATSLGQIQETESQLHQAAEHFRHVLTLAGDPPLSGACESHLGLGRIAYAWNDLDAAQAHAELGLLLGRQMENVDTPASAALLLARLALARSDAAGAAREASSAEQYVRENNFVHRLPDVAAMQALVALRQGQPEKAEKLAESYHLPLIQARVHLAKGDTSQALAVLEAHRQAAVAKGWTDELLKAMVLQSVVLDAHGEEVRAGQTLDEALALAEPGGELRIFVDEGASIANLLASAAARGSRPDFVSRLLAAFEAEPGAGESQAFTASPQPLLEPLSPRELEVLRLIAAGFSNQEIGARLFLALNTVKGYNRKIFNKLEVQRRTEAVARARQLGLV